MWGLLRGQDAKRKGSRDKTGSGGLLEKHVQSKGITVSSHRMQPLCAPESQCTPKSAHRWGENRDGAWSIRTGCQRGPEDACLGWPSGVFWGGIVERG